MKLINLLKSVECLSRLYTTPVNGVTAAKLSSLADVARQHIQVYEDARYTLLSSCAEELEGEDGSKGFKFHSEDDRDRFIREHQDILDSEVPEPATKLSTTDLPFLTITPAELADLSWAIE